MRKRDTFKDPCALSTTSTQTHTLLKNKILLPTTFHSSWALSPCGERARKRQKKLSISSGLRTAHKYFPQPLSNMLFRKLLYPLTAIQYNASKEDHPFSRLVQSGEATEEKARQCRLGKAQNVRGMKR